MTMLILIKLLKTANLIKIKKRKEWVQKYISVLMICNTNKIDYHFRQNVFSSIDKGEIIILSSEKMHKGPGAGLLNIQVRTTKVLLNYFH